MSKAARGDDGFPTRTFGLAVGAVCLLIALSSVYTYRLLDQLAEQFLHGRGEDIATSIDLSLRGPRRRPDPQEWQKVFDENLEAYSASAAFLALADGSGKVLAFSGLDGRGGPQELDRLRDDPEVWLFEREVRSRRQDAPGAREVHGWRLVVGLRTEPAAFIHRAAKLHLAAAALGILSLIGLAVYSLRTWDQLAKLRAREESERSLASLGRLSATLAHEIRNPLGAIKGLTQVVQEQLPREDPKREHLLTVVAEAERLEKLVQDLLQFARPREPKLSRVGLLRQLENARQIMETDLASRGVLMRIAAENGEVLCQSDADGLQQVFLNVLRNALEASPEGAEITVSVSRKGRFGRIVVDDHGSGLAEDPAALFEPFKTSKLQGTGLGLSVSKQIVERLGGAISLENHPEGGARCTVSVPL